MTGLEAGVAPHHAGMVPPMKETVEACFVRGLTKVVFATETLGTRHQHAGPDRGARQADEVDRRAPRVPHAGPVHPAHRASGAPRNRYPRSGRGACGRRSCRSNRWRAWRRASKDFVLTSAFRPTYNMAANLVRRYDPEAGRAAPQPLVRPVPDRRRRGARASRSSSGCSTGERQLVGRLEREVGDLDELRASHRPRRSRSEVDAARDRLRPQSR